MLGPLVFGELLGSGETFLATAAAARDVAREFCRHQGSLLLSRSLPHQPAKRYPGSGEVDVSAGLCLTSQPRDVQEAERWMCQPRSLPHQPAKRCPGSGEVDAVPSAFPEAWPKLKFFLQAEVAVGVIFFW